MIRFCVACFVLLLAAACVSTAPVEADLALEDVRVIDLDDGSVERIAQIVIEDGLIVHIGSKRPLAGTVRVIDGQGAYVIPGLWDAHTHSVSAADWHFPLMVRHGITSIRNMHTSEPDPFEKLAELRRRTQRGDLTGPFMIANGPIVDGPRPAWPGAVSVASAQEAEQAVSDLSAAGADFIKVYDGLPPDAFDALMAQAKETGIPVDGHLPSRVDPKVAASLGLRTDEHLSGMVMGCSARQSEIRAEYANLAQADPLPFPQDMIAFFDLVQTAAETWDADLCRDTAAVYARYGTAVTPTLVNLRSLTDPASLMQDDPAITLLPPDFAEAWRNDLQGPQAQAMMAVMAPVAETVPEMLSILQQAGVPILAGTDIGNPFLVPGYHLHTEMELMVEAGMAPLDALRSATILPAEILLPEEKLGKVAVGYRADIVLLEDNPLEDISHTRSIRTVILRGAEVPLD